MGTASVCLLMTIPKLGSFPHFDGFSVVRCLRESEKFSKFVTPMQISVLLIFTIIFCSSAPTGASGPASQLTTRSTQPKKKCSIHDLAGVAQITYRLQRELIAYSFWSRMHSQLQLLTDRFRLDSLAFSSYLLLIHSNSWALAIG